MTLAMGLMSGTSADGVSAALVSFKGRSFRLLHYQTFPYPESLREKILKASRLPLAEISQLNFELGNYFARAALNWSDVRPILRQRVSVIGSHGQTVYHGPRGRVPSTLQIGEAAVIAEITGIPVVSDFRPQDIALGGEGAPLIPFFDHYFYGNGPLRAFQNIGGIANVTIVGRRLKEPIAFDTGPGNCLIDLAIQKITGGKSTFDRNGNLARKGKIDFKLIQKMARHPYFKRQPPKSTGREEFGEEFLKKYFGRTIFTRPHDTLATLTYFTAYTIFKSVTCPPKGTVPFGGQVTFFEIVVSGGGAKNPVLMKYLRELFSPVPVRSIEEFGIPAQAKEPIAFAFFALRALQGKINHLPSATGARQATILGKIIRPSPVPQKVPGTFWGTGKPK